ncbi:MAG: dihydropteroate synthase [Fimbriimonas sp.]
MAIARLTDRPLVMGILNVTPDSFSDGGRHFSFAAAVDAGSRMMDEGADLIDVGGESTRPGAEPVDAEEEIRRTVPVVEALVARGFAVSIDTMKATVARAAVLAGAEMVNDVTAFSDPAMAEVCAEAGCAVCLMHMQGRPQTMQLDPTYGDVVAEVAEYLVGRAHFAEAAGIDPAKIWLDPGIGFGKTLEHNLALIRNLGDLVATGYPVLLGVSRKSFLSKIGKPLGVDERLEGSLAAQTVGQIQGAAMLRVHDVLAARRAVDATAAILASPAAGTARVV